jgi:hypothetical protein
MSDDTKTFYADAGKGDRPRGTGWKNYYDNFDNIFGKKDESVKEEAGCGTTVEVVNDVSKADEG